MFLVHNPHIYLYYSGKRLIQGKNKLLRKTKITDSTVIPSNQSLYGNNYSTFPITNILYIMYSMDIFHMHTTANLVSELNL